MTQHTWPLLDAAHDALRTTVAGVRADQWAAPTPCSEWNVTQVVQHSAGDQLGFAAFLTGGPGPEEDPFAPSGTLSGDPVALVEKAVSAAADAFGTVSPDATEIPVPVPPNSMPPALGVAACALDAAVHAWDIALATGQPSPLTPEMSRELLDAARQFVEPLRAYGVYAPADEVAPNEDPTTALLRYLGRNPAWSA
ncbi:TIGR03086 family protein [Nocardia puris]|uniref:Uncharacterized protein (TIGR03086 family) n=1 Tax=Nocardia puris TaxID=208602 RepID=A0A366E210_9NOCA|nr:TIGR03086 family metal-binding protein [Nocardia puris]MBF6212771.1 TIGR03086 family protein [Nocardia puris]MBF6367708.1 TIGR03086 family protein [Nocardia puris]MBF6461359.1 TIGR03086 family protein [Nocardia puris]RBO96406.1 uncharacterized protein (TIGR03086 family) [Nocardia puris]